MIDFKLPANCGKVLKMAPNSEMQLLVVHTESITNVIYWFLIHE